MKNIRKLLIVAAVLASLTLAAVPAAAAEGGSTWKDKVSDLWQTTKAKAPGVWEATKEKTDELYETAKEKLPEAASKAKDGLENAQEAFSSWNQSQQDQFWDWAYDMAGGGSQAAALGTDPGENANPPTSDSQGDGTDSDTAQSSGSDLAPPQSDNTTGDTDQDASSGEYTPNPTPDQLPDSSAVHPGYDDPEPFEAVEDLPATDSPAVIEQGDDYVVIDGERYEKVAESDKTWQESVKEVILVVATPITAAIAVVVLILIYLHNHRNDDTGL